MKDTLPTRLLTEGAKLPVYGSAEAAGMDLSADLTSTGLSHVTIVPGEILLIKTGVSVALPPAHYGRIAPRSGLAYKHGIDVMGGVIDSDYRGDIGVILINHGDEDFRVEHGDRIAQMIVTPYVTSLPVIEEELDGTERGGDGFGSTGQ